MKFDQKNVAKKIGRKMGFGIGFLVFCSIFFLILTFFHKIPSYVQYWHVLIAVIIVYFLGTGLKMVIKK